MARYRQCQIGNQIYFFDILETRSEQMIREYRTKLRENYLRALEQSEKVNKPPRLETIPEELRCEE